MRLLITGANGFLGKYVVSEALRRGHFVKALVRPASKSIPSFWEEHQNLELARGDLRDRNSIKSISEGIDCVVHLAATKAGDLYEQLGGTVVATENLLADMERSGVGKIVSISSFSVYEYMRKLSRTILDEKSSLAVKPLKRDEYCQTKMEQEKLIIHYVDNHDCKTTILRPGVIFGKDNLWTARLGMKLSHRKWLATGRLARLPLTYVENCAEAIIISAEKNETEKVQIYNIVDDNPPVQKSYMNYMRQQYNPKPKVIVIPWGIMRFIGRSVWIADKLFFQGKAKIPGIVYPDKLHSRNKPLKYSNKKIKSSLNWTPRYSWREGVLRALSDKDFTALD